MSQNRWKIQTPDQAIVNTLVEQASLNPIVAAMLVNRGVKSVEQSNRFNDRRLTILHDPALLPGAAEAAARIAGSIRTKEKICVYGDYDVDGTSATSILYGFLKKAGADADYYIPHRIEEGYGLNSDAIRSLKDRGFDVVVTVDCGITAVEQARVAKEVGLDLIITDHHHFDENDLPQGAILVHPKLPGTAYPFGEICGAGVAFKLAWQTAKLLGDGDRATPEMRDYLLKAISLVAIATISDVMPLHDENRILVRYGLNQIGAKPSVGMAALLKVASHPLGKDVSSEVVGWKLGPRINAAGRMAAASEVVKLMTTEDEDEAARIAAYLDQCNKDRQKLGKVMAAQAVEMVEMQGGLKDKGGIVLCHPDWHPGIVGIVASRLVEAYNRPSIVLVEGDDGHCHGSGRSVGRFNVLAAVESCADILVRKGGHAAACGVGVHKSKLGEFGERFHQYCVEHLVTDDYVAEILCDAEVALTDVTAHVIDQIDKFEPYGKGNPKPVLVSRNCRLVEAPRLVGDKKTHAQLRLEYDGVVRKAIWFNSVEKVKPLAEGQLIDICYSPSINEWMGTVEIQAEIIDVKQA